MTRTLTIFARGCAVVGWMAACVGPGGRPDTGFASVSVGVGEGGDGTAAGGSSGQGEVTESGGVTTGAHTSTSGPGTSEGTRASEGGEATSVAGDETTAAAETTGGESTSTGETTGAMETTATTCWGDDCGSDGGFEPVPCDPLVQDCEVLEVCIFAPDFDGFECHIDASGEEGQRYDPCEFPNACDAGLLCVTPDAAVECDPNFAGCCMLFCDPSDPDAEAKCGGEGQVCHLLMEAVGVCWYMP